MTKIKHPADDTLLEWKRMTHNNDHNAVRIQIAKWLHWNSSAAVYVGDVLYTYREIADRCEANGCLLICDSFARIGADAVMLARVRAVDAALADKIHACL